MKKRVFAAELQRIKDTGLSESTHISWVDIKDRFIPMGVKAIGLFLQQLIQEGTTAPDKYVIGFQHFPDSAPGLGNIGAALTKISARVPQELKEKIEQGALPDLMRLIPEATAALGGIADGCHRFSAASLIRRDHERPFIDALESLLS
jgi:hypothetical protein